MQAFSKKRIASDRQQSRLRITIRGAVQGVGFRPFVYRLATELGLPGWVNNSSQGVFIEVEGTRELLETFLLRLEPEKPPRAFIQSLEPSYLDPAGYYNFEIRSSEDAGEKSAFVLPDIATCDDCLVEILDPSDRRYLYPFTNCTNCGPRFTIIEALPYDRQGTAMKHFAMCDECRTEFEDPLNRRFHAQPNACPECGPHIRLWNTKGETLSTGPDALLHTAAAIRRGYIVAVKGLGGFHLIVDARSDSAVRRLRELKHREEKPLAVMYPSLESIDAECEVSELEKRLLSSPEAPIVLLSSKSAIRDSRSEISSLVAPGNPYLGVMLPYTPLHHLLLAELEFPIVATSGNLSDEPICTDEFEALRRLGKIADLFLVHNRPIVRHVDDSIVRVMMDREMVLRRARGYAPLPVQLGHDSPPLLAVGAHLKNAVATSVGSSVFISQHIGDLETAEAFNAFQRVITSFGSLYEVHPEAVVCDLHPDYLSTRFANRCGLKPLSVQHHYAHVISCMAENQLQEPVLGISWDGTGYGSDGTIWGGEFLRILPDGSKEDCACRRVEDARPFQRVAHLRTFKLPGGDRAIVEPRRTAIGLLFELLGDRAFEIEGLPSLSAFPDRELGIIKTMLVGNTNAPITSSAGRVFDAVASIMGLRQKTQFEGQAAMELEFALGGLITDQQYAFDIRKPAASSTQAYVVDWGEMVKEIIDDSRRRAPVRLVSAKFHNTLVEMMIAVASRIGEERVVLTGGCFQNRYLTERAVTRLREHGFRPYWHQRVPPNDGGIALGQAVAASRSLSR
ncbi:MAG TPA: carbamoyltransferase HypF [Blastocatellia bacterium]|nr:carbamoyltransferase HypF [Blastocatellia bacterium]